RTGRGSASGARGALRGAVCRLLPRGNTLTVQDRSSRFPGRSQLISDNTGGRDYEETDAEDVKAQRGGTGEVCGGQRRTGRAGEAPAAGGWSLPRPPDYLPSRADPSDPGCLNPSSLARPLKQFRRPGQGEEGGWWRRSGSPRIGLPARQTGRG